MQIRSFALTFHIASYLIDSLLSPLSKTLQWTPCSSLNMLGMPLSWSLLNFLSGALFPWISHFPTSFMFLLKNHLLAEAFPDHPSCFSLHSYPLPCFILDLYKNYHLLNYCMCLFYLFIVSFSLNCHFPKARIFCSSLCPK